MAKPFEGVVFLRGMRASVDNGKQQLFGVLVVLVECYANSTSVQRRCFPVLQALAEFNPLMGLIQHLEVTLLRPAD